MHYLFVNIHNLLFWLILIAGIIAYYRSVLGTFGNLRWSGVDNTSGNVLFHTINFQFIIGLVLYIFLSPHTHEAFSNFGDAMGNTTLRFWAVEHIVMMIAALAVFHIGTAKVKRADTDRSKFKARFIYYTITFILIILAIPWPFRSMGRNLIPFY